MVYYLSIAAWQTAMKFNSLKLQTILFFSGFPGGTEVKNLPANEGYTRDTGLIPRLRRFPWRRKWQPTPVFLSGKSHGQRSLGSYRLSRHKELNSIEHICTHFYFWPHYMACSILVSSPGNESSPQQWKCRVFTTGLPRNSLKLQTFNLKFLWVRILGVVLQKPKLGGSHLEVSPGCSQCTGCVWGSLKTWRKTCQDVSFTWLSTGGLRSSP